MIMKSMADAEQTLKKVWGYDRFRPHQEQSIRSVMEKQDSLTVLPTGGGKSLCYQVPALCMDGMAVVVSPLISLMKDQVDALQACGVAAAFVNSTQTNEEKRQVADQIQKKKLKLLYVAPERLLTDRMIEFLSGTNVSFFAIDEAHCISNWGHDFRPEYRGLRLLKERFPNASVHAYTATASAPVRNDIVTQLGLIKPEIYVGNFDRPNLVYRMMRSQDRLKQVFEIVSRHRNESGIVYCISRKEVERTAAYLEHLGITAKPYHAGMDDERRKAHQDAFIKETFDVIVATVAFGMGIDKSNVRYVIHAGMPKSIEHYQQESGRAGRDGLESECILLYSTRDLMTWKTMLESERSEGSESALRSLNAMNDLCNSGICRHKALVEYFGQPFTKDNCEACDVCLNEVAMVDDPITISQKILSCVVRLEERFGAAHTAKVLTGSMEQRIKDFGHDKLSTYGLLSDEGPNAVRMWIDQLINQGFLNRTGEYQLLSLTDTGRKLLRRDGNPRLTIAAKTTASKRPPSTELISWDGVDRELFEQLRKLRAEFAAARSVPAYIIFGDETLRELARVRPTTIDRLSGIRGIGAQKKNDFGDRFVETIRIFCEEKSVAVDVTVIQKPRGNVADKNTTSEFAPSPGSLVAFPHFQAGLSIEEAAKKMGRANSTVGGYLIDYIRYHKVIDSSPWVDPQLSQKIVSHLHLLEDRKLKPLFEFFEAKIPYDTLRIVATCYENSLSPLLNEST